MEELWYPEAIKNLAARSLWGPDTPGLTYRGVLHTTESTWYRPFPGPQDEYDGFGHDYFPEFTLDTTRGDIIDGDHEGQFYQHMPANCSARALKNLLGGVETNKWNAVQVEIVWTASKAPDLPKVVLDTLARWMRWVEAELGVKRIAPNFHPYPPPSPVQLNGKEPWRMTGEQWRNFNGWCGHQHVPENVHGDPGLIDIDYLLLVKEPIPQEEDMPPELYTDEQGVVWLCSYSTMTRFAIHANAQKFYEDKFGKTKPVNNFVVQPFKIVTA